LSQVSAGGRRFVSILIAAAGFGLVMAIIKGQGADARDALGNISTPWLLLAFVAGASSTRGVRIAALRGLGATFVALAAFYVSESFVLDLGRHSWLTDLGLTMRAGGVYFVQALVSGPVLGGLGGVWARGRSALIAAGVALLFVFEPVVVWMYQRYGGNAASTGVLTQYRWMWIGEVVVGVSAAVVIARRHRRE
jgi:hypothetical protein